MLYGAGDFAGAVFETVFHDVPVRGVRRVPHAKLLHRLVVALAPAREVAPEVPLTLAAGAGLDAVCAAANRAGITITGLA